MRAVVRRDPNIKQRSRRGIVAMPDRHELRGAADVAALGQHLTDVTDLAFKALMQGRMALVAPAVMLLNALILAGLAWQELGQLI